MTVLESEGITAAAIAAGKDPDARVCAKPLRFLDETLRNGQQSLWATRMKTKSMLPIAPVMNEAGFDEICAMAGVSFETSAMYLFEDPWERIRLLHQLMPSTRLDGLVRARNLWGWRSQPYDVQELFLKTLLRNGMDSIKVFDGLNDYRNLAWLVNKAKDLGFKVKGLVGFALTPAHTDEYLAKKASELMDLNVDALVFTDSAGLLYPERCKSAVTAIREVIGETEMHFHSHTITGLANDCYREAIRAGVDVVWTAARPLAYGKAVPWTMDVLQMAMDEGRETMLDESKIREIDDWFYWVAHEEGKPIPEEVRFDPAFYQQYAGHQIPGGMFSNMVKQLADLGIEHRLPEVLEETARVRAELGHPHMVTPFSQFVGVQAVLNVMEGKRYSKVPEEVRLYARGYYGLPIHPLDPNIQDQLIAGESLLDPLEGLDEPSLPRIRAEHGPFDSDEDLLQFLFLNPNAYNNFRKYRKPITWNPTRSPLVSLIKELSKETGLSSVQFSRGSLKLKLTAAKDA
ncbi:MAG: pyruvate carboxylase subunit B [Actinomycetota bacterium]|nr:MAG: pyruvate carboxylase subunit B [Actinomycetota bacterium]